MVIAVALTATASAFIGLDILPERDLPGSVVLKLNPDSGETIGWPHFTATVAGVYRSVPEPARRQTAIFTQNYGEAGAIAEFGPALGLPYPHSGHNAWWLWGPPPDRDRTVVVVGLPRRRVQPRSPAARSGPGSTMGSASTTTSRATRCGCARASVGRGRSSGSRFAITTSVIDPRVTCYSRVAT